MFEEVIGLYLAYPEELPSGSDDYQAHQTYPRLTSRAGE